MPSITYNITTSDAAQAVTLKGKRQALTQARYLIQGLTSGTVIGSVDIHTSTSDAAAAAGTITLTYANIDANDTVTIGGVTLTAKASGANGTTEFNKQTDATVTAANLVTTINANTTLSPHVIATSAAGVVTVTARLKGSLGNLIVMSTSDATAFALVQLTGGAGGPASTVTSF